MDKEHRNSLFSFLAKINKRYLGLIILGVLAGLLLGYLFFDHQEALAPINRLNLVQNKKDTKVNLTDSISQKLEVEGQIPGSVIVVKKVVMDQPGWLAVADDNDGQMGRILGANYLPAGTYQNILISLLRSVSDGQTYFAVICQDDGDKEFNYQTDLPITASDGEPLNVLFQVTAASSRGDWENLQPML